MTSAVGRTVSREPPWLRIWLNLDPAIWNGCGCWWQSQGDLGILVKFCNSIRLFWSGWSLGSMGRNMPSLLSVWTWSSSCVSSSKHHCREQASTLPYYQMSEMILPDTLNYHSYTMVWRKLFAERMLLVSLSSFFCLPMSNGRGYSLQRSTSNLNISVACQKTAWIALWGLLLMAQLLVSGSLPLPCPCGRMTNASEIFKTHSCPLWRRFVPALLSAAQSALMPGIPSWILHDSTTSICSFNHYCSTNGTDTPIQLLNPK